MPSIEPLVAVVFENVCAACPGNHAHFSFGIAESGVSVAFLANTLLVRSFAFPEGVSIG